MSKKFYYFTISFLALTFLQDVVLMIVEYEAGNKIYLLPSYLPSFILGAVVRVTGLLALQQYYRSRGYSLAFLASWLYVFTNVVLECIVVGILTGSKLEGWYFVSAGAIFGVSFLLGLSLWISKSRERRWLKYAGMALSVIGSVQLVVLFLFLNFAGYQGKFILERINFGLGWISAFVPWFYILDLVREWKKTPDEVPVKSGKKLFAVLSGVSIILLVLTVFLGWKLNTERFIPPRPQVISQRAEAIASRFERRSFVNSEGDTLLYRLFKPVNYDPGRKYPLVLCLHHGGAHGNDNVVQVEGSYAPFLSDYNNRINYPAILLVPQCPNQMAWWSREIDLSIIELIGALEKEWNVDTRRRYVLGESGGGYGSWHFIGNHPELFAAAVPVCGSGDKNLAGNIANRAVWAFHGAQDPFVPVGKSREMVQAIREAGGNPRYTEFATAGHAIAREVYVTPGFLDWLFAQKRPD